MHDWIQRCVIIIQNSLFSKDFFSRHSVSGSGLFGASGVEFEANVIITIFHFHVDNNTACPRSLVQFYCILTIYQCPLDIQFICINLIIAV